MNSLPILLIGAPFALFRFAFARFRKQQSAVPVAERVDCWAGFTKAKLNNPPLAEMEVRP